MPRYEYECGECGKRFDAMQTFDEHDQHVDHDHHEPLECPGCHSRKVEQLMGAAVFVVTSKKS
jgi:putative FmdB family regulatory protein